ncbi:hypothetical protein ACH5TX_00055, partial [Flavobacteriaceae bacterium MEBiC06459]
ICDDDTPTASCSTATVTVTVACSSLVDSDGDGLTDCEETTGIDDPSTSKVPGDYPGPFEANDACLPTGVNTTDSDGDG